MGTEVMLQKVYSMTSRIPQSASCWLWSRPGTQGLFHISLWNMFDGCHREAEVNTSLVLAPHPGFTVTRTPSSLALLAGDEGRSLISPSCDVSGSVFSSGLLPDAPHPLGQGFYRVQPHLAAWSHGEMGDILRWDPQYADWSKSPESNFQCHWWSWTCS